MQLISLRPIAAGVILAIGLSATVGCYGSFPATRSLYRFNGKITDNGIIHSIALIVLVIIPVYGVCMLVDGIILNSIEFWSGDRVNVSRTEVLEDGTEVTLAPGSHDDEAILTLARNGETIVTRTYLRIDSTTTQILDEQGTVVATAQRDATGGIAVRDAAGNTVADLDHSQILAMANQRAR